MVCCISTFLEEIDHEFQDFREFKVNRKAYRVDRNGIKAYCQLNAMKSVDYYEDHQNKSFLVVEFSDLIKQDQQIALKVQELLDSNLDKRLKTEIRKNYYNEINRELIQKYKDSLHIKNTMSTCIKNIPQSFNGIADFVVVVAPIDEKNRIDIVRFIEQLKAKLCTGLSKGMVKNIHIVPLDHFISAS